VKRQPATAARQYCECFLLTRYIPSVSAGPSQFSCQFYSTSPSTLECCQRSTLSKADPLHNSTPLGRPQRSKDRSPPPPSTGSELSPLQFSKFTDRSPAPAHPLEKPGSTSRPSRNRPPAAIMSRPVSEFDYTMEGSPFTVLNTLPAGLDAARLYEQCGQFLATYKQEGSYAITVLSLRSSRFWATRVPPFKVNPTLILVNLRPRRAQQSREPQQPPFAKP
jgi:hypothetical protein